MISAIVYQSKTGSCERYARELSRGLHVPCYPADNCPLRGDAQAIFVSWIMAGGVTGYAKAAKRFNLAAVVAVGMAPATEKSVEAGRAKNKIPPRMGYFVRQGGFNIHKLPLPMRLIMQWKTKDIAKGLAAKKATVPLSAQEEATYRMAADGQGEPASWDVSDIVAWVNENYKSEGVLHI